jgi:hypothetical protein
MICCTGQVATVCAPNPPLFSARRFVTGVLAAAMGIFALFMANRLSKVYPFEHDFAHHLDSPVLALELATNARELHAVLGPSPGDNPKDEETVKAAHDSLRSNTYQDFLFIPLYTSFVWFFGTLFAAGPSGRRSASGHFLGFIVIAVFALDCLENRGILNALGASVLSDSLAQQICWPSRCKWALFGIALLLTAVILGQTQHSVYSTVTRRLLAMGYAIAGSLVIAGLWRPRLIELANEVFGVLVLINIVALLGPYFGRLLRERVPETVPDFCARRKHVSGEVSVTPKLVNETQHGNE